MIVRSYNMLSEPCQIRHDNLEDSLMLFTFYRDVEDELSWIREKRPIAAMTDLGTNLTTVQNLQKKHQVQSYSGVQFHDCHCHYNISADKTEKKMTEVIC